MKIGIIGLVFGTLVIVGVCLRAEDIPKVPTKPVVSTELNMEILRLQRDSLLIDSQIQNLKEKQQQINAKMGEKVGEAFKVCRTWGTYNMMTGECDEVTKGPIKEGEKKK